MEQNIKQLSHKLSWWQTWLVMVVAIAATSWIQFNYAYNQGKHETEYWQTHQAEAAETVEEERTDKEYVDYFREKVRLIGWTYSFEANFFHMEKCHWQNKTLQRFICWRRALIGAFLLMIIGGVKIWKYSRKISIILGNNPGLDKRARSDAMFSARGLVLATVALALCPVAMTSRLRWIQDNTSVFLYVCWLVMLGLNSLLFKFVKKGDLDFSAAPEGAANVAGFVRTLWRKIRRRRRAQPRRRRRGFWDDLLFRWGRR